MGGRGGWVEFGAGFGVGFVCVLSWSVWFLVVVVGRGEFSEVRGGPARGGGGCGWLGWWLLYRWKWGVLCWRGAYGLCFVG